MNHFAENNHLENRSADIMESLLMREQNHGFEDSLSDYLNNDKKVAHSDVHAMNDCGFIETVAQL